MMVQVTTFAYGGTDIAVGISHPLADTHSLACFVLDWAKISSSTLTKESLPKLSPNFQPSLIDAAAAGDIDAATPSPDLL